MLDIEGSIIRGGVKIPNTGYSEPIHSRALVTGMRQRIQDDGMEYVKNGGEARAYGDGKTAYDALIVQISARTKAE